LKKRGEIKMLKLKIGVVDYYVGDGVEMRRLWKKAVKAGFSGYQRDTTPPKYDIKGTYAMEFIGKTLFWSNFKTIAKTGILMMQYCSVKGQRL
jgi:hypothetical protein